MFARDRFFRPDSRFLRRISVELVRGAAGAAGAWRSDRRDHSPHIVRAVEVNRNRPIIYSAGDFVDASADAGDRDRDLGHRPFAGAVELLRDGVVHAAAHLGGGE
ncbi:MAG: CapA family protein [Ramlibacter sp.]|nr:CapA family protein [Cryobacterium sp.]